MNDHDYAKASRVIAILRYHGGTRQQETDFLIRKGWATDQATADTVLAALKKWESERKTDD